MKFSIGNPTDEDDIDDILVEKDGRLVRQLTLASPELPPGYQATDSVTELEPNVQVRYYTIELSTLDDLITFVRATGKEVTIERQPPEMLKEVGGMFPEFALVLGDPIMDEDV